MQTHTSERELQAEEVQRQLRDEMPKGLADKDMDFLPRRSIFMGETTAHMDYTSPQTKEIRVHAGAGLRTKRFRTSTASTDQSNTDSESRRTHTLL